MYTVPDLRQLHLEVSTRCNAECPMCARNLFGATGPALTETSMTLKQFRTCLPEHVLAQLEIAAARARATELGFAEFSRKKAARFLRPLYEPAPELRPGDGIDAAPIYDRTGAVVGELRPPADERLINEVVLWARGIEARAEYFDEFFDTCAVQCLGLDSSAIFLAATGHVYPCCWLYVQATLPQLYGAQAATDRQVHDLLADTGGSDTLNAAEHPP